MSGVIGAIASYKISSGGGGGLLLDSGTLTAAVLCGYSLRQIKTTATNAIRVQISGGANNGNQYDIGFVAGVLDQTSLLANAAGADAYIAKWYDQSGNGKDLLQPTLANMPQIVSSGSVIKLNTLPVIWSQDFSVHLTKLATNATDISLGGTTACMAAVFSRGAADFAAANFAGYQANGDGSTNAATTSALFIGRETDNGDRFAGWRNGSELAFVTASDVLHTIMARFTGSQYSLSIDAGTAATASNSSTFGATGALVVGSTNSSTRMHNAGYGELLFFAVDPGSTDRSTIQISQKTFWGTP